MLQPIIRTKLYRAWDIRNKVMVKQALVLSETQQLVTVNAEYFNSPFSFFDGIIWMEYTGCDDLRTAPCFEDDIIVCDIGKGRVVFSAGCFMIGWIDDPEANMEPLGFERKFGRVRKFEIVGNAHEHPALLIKKE